MAFCVRSDVTGGHLQTGKKTVPIENPLALTGGTNEAFGEFTTNSEGDLTKVKQKVPGGILGLTGRTWLLEFFGSDALTLYATTELAGIPNNFTFSSVTLPIKVHLTTPSNVLGSNATSARTATRSSTSKTVSTWTTRLPRRAPAVVN